MSHEDTPSVTRRGLLRLLVLLAGICSLVVGLVGAVVGFVGTYLFPMVVIVAVIIYVVALGLWVAERWPVPPSRDRRQ